VFRYSGNPRLRIETWGTRHPAVLDHDNALDAHVEGEAGDLHYLKPYFPVSDDEIANDEELCGRHARRACGERTRATRAAGTAI
jgi:hypothetical protein